MKGNISKYKDNLIEFIKNNRLFFSFVIISIFISLLLRLITINGHFYIKALLSDAFIVILIGLLGYFVNSKNRFKYYFIWICFFSILCIANTVYYQFYKSFISINLLATASMVSKVNDSLFAKFHIIQFIYLIFPIIYILLNKYFNKKRIYENISNKYRIFKYSGVFCLIILIYLIFSFSKSDINKFTKLYNREYVVNKYGLYFYTINDLIQSLTPKIDNYAGYDSAALQYRNFYACKWKNEKKEENEFTNKFKGKNVIFIHAESIQNFLINLEINDKEVTPNLNRLSKEGIYFSKFYPQISIGTSSDTEFTLTTGLMPSSSGTVFVNYYDRKYMGMPEYFNNLGYYTFSTHANDADYWNRKTMHETLGYKDFYAKDYYYVPTDFNDKDYIGLGLSDKSFFKQFIPILKEIKSLHELYFGTVITLSNHSPFKAVDKYGDFDVRNEILDEDYLEGSEMGNYIKSAHYADEALGEFFEELESNNLLDNTIFIIYGDHEARLPKKEFDRLINYDYITGKIDSNDDNYTEITNYDYDLLKNTPLIIWSNDEEFNLEVDDVMGMYDVLPTIANMFGFEEKYSLGHDIFSNNEKIVVFPNGNVLTNKIYYSDLNEEYIAFNDEPISSDYIDNLKEYANNILEVSDGIIKHDLIRYETRIGECNK